MRFAICNEIFQGWKIDDVFTHCARLGYGAVEVSPFTLAPHVTDIPATERTRIREAAARAGIAISGIHWVLVQTEGMHLTSPDPATRARTARYFVDLVDFCADLGGEVIVVGSPKQRSLADGVTPAQGWAWMAETFRPSIKRAEERGVTICLEPLPAEDTNFINTAEEAVRFAREQGSPRFKVILDVRPTKADGSGGDVEFSAVFAPSRQNWLDFAPIFPGWETPTKEDRQSAARKAWADRLSTAPGVLVTTDPGCKASPYFKQIGRANA